MEKEVSTTRIWRSGGNQPYRKKWLIERCMGQGRILSIVPARNDKKVGRNDPCPCPCESGKKYKKCCGR